MRETAAVAILTTVGLEEGTDGLLRLVSMPTCLPLAGEELIDPGVVVVLLLRDLEKGQGQLLELLVGQDGRTATSSLIKFLLFEEFIDLCDTSD